MKRVLSVLSFLFLASCSSVPQKSQNFELKEILVPLEGLKIYHYQHLSNGLNIYLSPGFAKHMVSYVTAYNVGSRDEKKGQIGLAHLFEHLMFRGTRDFKDPFAALSSMGARFNAYTSQDQTVYYADVPSINLEKLIHLESDRMRNLKIDEEGFFKERGAVVSERKLNTVDSPGGRMFWELFKLAYEKHPYKYTPIGRQEDLDRVTFQNTLSFYEEHYAPQSASIAIVGDFQVSQVLKLMDHYYGAFQKKVSA